MQTYNWFNLPEYEGVSLPTESAVEVDGYIPAEVQIQNLLNAGMRLAESRKEQFQYEGEEGFNSPPAIEPEDRADAFMQAEGVQKAIVSHMDKRASEALEKAKKASEEPSEGKSPEKAPKGD